MQVVIDIFAAIGVIAIIYGIYLLVVLVKAYNSSLVGDKMIKYLRQGNHKMVIDLCPFCGYDSGELVEINNKYAMKCIMCGSATKLCETPEEALMLWNIRNGEQTQEWVIDEGE